jgi:hypothetical protein
MSAAAWVVECVGCKCLIVACGIDPQDEHGKQATATPPLSSAVINCPCCNSDYRYVAGSIFRGQPKRNPACMRRQPTQPNSKMDGAVVVAASIVAAMRLRGEPIKRSPKVVSTIADSIHLARMVVESMK